jgi:antitoxin HicB
MNLAYPVDIERDEAGFWLVRFPDLAGAATDGETLEEAFANARDCLDEALAGYLNRRQPLPLPGEAQDRPVVAPSLLLGAKVALWSVLTRSGLQACQWAEQLSVDEATVWRLLDPRHRSHIGQIEQALTALGKQLVVELREAA